MICNLKHTKYQPESLEWLCPICGNNSDFFYVDYTRAPKDCELLHEDDEIYCELCNKEWSGEEASKILLKKKSQIPCPHCNGTGFIKKENQPKSKENKQ